MSFKSYSQAGQDQWVYQMFGPGYMGTFLDIGCCEPKALSNTYALEQLGWTGWLVDRSPVACGMCRKERTSPVFELDMTVHQLDLWASLPKVIDYASIDIDEGTLDALVVLPWKNHSFKAMTVEHDAYRFGDWRRQKIRQILEREGYALARSNVTHEGLEFEDWWVPV